MPMIFTVFIVGFFANAMVQNPTNMDDFHAAYRAQFEQPVTAPVYKVNE